MINNFEINEKYQCVFTTPKPIIDLVGGRGRGGSYFGTDYFLFLLITADYFRGCLARQAFNDIKDSLFKDLLDRIEEHKLNKNLFKINEHEMKITCKQNGNTIISKGFITSSNRKAKLKSLAGLTHVLIEEANEVYEEQFDNIMLSVRTKKVDKIQILRIFNPPSKRHWIWRDYNLIDSVKGYYTYNPKTDSDVEMIFSTYLDNIKNLNDTYISTLMRLKRRPEQYNVIVKGLISDIAVGKIYSDWNPISVSDYELIESRRVYAIDFGFSNDPVALIEVKWKDNKLFIRELIYQTGMDDLMIAKRFLDLGITYKDLIIADYGNGGDVRINNLMYGGSGAWKNIEGYEDLIKGFSVYYAKKGAGSIAGGINLVKSYEIYVTENSKNCWEEYQNYCWASGRDSNLLDVPVDKYNHIMDCIRYFCLYRAQYGV
jgi:phage terminase large subunit